MHFPWRHISAAKWSVLKKTQILWWGENLSSAKIKLRLCNYGSRGAPRCCGCFFGFHHQMKPLHLPLYRFVRHRSHHLCERWTGAAVKAKDLQRQVRWAEKGSRWPGRHPKPFTSWRHPSKMHFSCENNPTQPLHPIWAIHIMLIFFVLGKHFNWFVS